MSSYDFSSNRIDINSNITSELGIDDEQDQEEFERQRLIKGVNQRLKENRPKLFDLFYVNTGNFLGYSL